MNQHDMTRNMVLAALFAALTAIGAFLQIPTGTVPITLQFLFTALAGLLLGWKWGAISQLLYVGLGLLGGKYALELSCRSLRKVAASAMCSSPASAFCWG